MQTSVSSPASTIVVRPVAARAAAIGGLSPAAKTGFTSTGVPAARCASTDGHVWPFASGSSSVTTVGTPSARASSATQATRVAQRLERRAIDVRALVAVEALLGVDHEQGGFVAAEQAHARTLSEPRRPDDRVRVAG